ncbi:homoserine kinase [Ramlibacter sp. PS4R-6]|uniref:homoserine kinase n=1 Tax=Ramlibacter sp. PS4R-6 TaxID=3133438 RepID=UPI0030B1212D
MAVFTEVPEEAAGALLRRLDLGELASLRGIQGGIENTNYFLTAEKEGVKHEFVLTLFERLSHEQLPFYLYLMKHLARHGIPVPEPQCQPGTASAAHPEGELLFTLEGKPAAVVEKLRGHSELQPTPAHCAAVGATLARMHLQGRDFTMVQPNLRGLAWWNETVPVVLPYVDPDQAALLRSELAFQNHVAASSAYAALPRGPVHADLFRDNVMFEDGKLTGFFDFYFAGVDTWLFDVAVCLNDWCIALETGAHDEERARAFLDAYGRVRPFSTAERHLLPAMLRAGALRFWISRLWDFHLPREAALLKPHDPTHFERVLRQRVAFAPQTLR